MEEEEEKIAGQQESLREEKFDAAPGTSAPKRPRIVYTPYVNKRQKISETPVQEEYDTDEDDDEDAESGNNLFLFVCFNHLITGVTLLFSYFHTHRSMDTSC